MSVGVDYHQICSGEGDGGGGVYALAAFALFPLAAQLTAGKKLMVLVMFWLSSPVKANTL